MRAPVSHSHLARPLDEALWWDARYQDDVFLGAVVRGRRELEVHRYRVAGLTIRCALRGAIGRASSPTFLRDDVADAAARALRTARALAAAGRSEPLPAPPQLRKPPALRLREDPLEAGLDPPTSLAKAAHAAVEGAVATAAARASVERRGVLSSSGDEIQWQVPRVYVRIEATLPGVATLGRRLGGAGGWDRAPPDGLDELVADLNAAIRLHARTQTLRESLPVITDPELGGVFAHEAVGHGMEADLMLRGESLFRDLLGKSVGPPELTIVDDPQYENGYGWIPVDDEGTPARRKVLIRRGVVNEPIHSRGTAARMDAEPNGGARAEGPGDEPIPRMTNTVVLAGTTAPQDLLATPKRAVLAIGTRGGQVDTTRGSFQFTPAEAYLLEHGERVAALRGTSLSGHLLEALAGIEAIGRDERLGSPGVCGKGQWVPVGDGAPHLLLSNVGVGSS